MAYFSNGEEGEYYERKFCARCSHYGDDGFGCPVWGLHREWNYDACNGDMPDATPEARAKHHALNALWPRDGAHNGDCLMFNAKEKL